MMRRVDQNKRKELRVFELKYRTTIKDWNFEPGRLVQVRNSGIEKNLDQKMYARYFGPLVVIRRTKGGSYILAEMDGTVLKEKVAAFRILPHVARYEPIELPQNIHDLIDLNKEQLEHLVNEEDNGNDPLQEDLIFDAIPNLRIEDESEDSASEDEDEL